jgi:ribosomal protein L37E
MPHETDKMRGYIETSVGLIPVPRGMKVQMVPPGQKGPSTQQELPGPGSNTGGNFGMPAGRGQGPGGAGPAQPGGAQQQACPRCGNRSLKIEGNQVACSSCGYRGSAQVSPAGQHPAVEHSLLQQPQRGPQGPSKVQLWSTRRPGAIAAHAAAVLQRMDGG